MTIIWNEFWLVTSKAFAGLSYGFLLLAQWANDKQVER